MASSEPSSDNKLLVGLSTEHDGDDTYTIHKVDDWTIDENEENKILITSHDATKYATKYATDDCKMLNV